MGSWDGSADPLSVVANSKLAQRLSRWEVTIEEKDVCFEGKSRLESKRCLFEVETIIV